MAETGRPTMFTQELANTICARLAMGESLRSVCREEGMPSLTSVFNWLHSRPQFLEQYAIAKEESADALSEEILDISDESINDAYKADPKAANAAVNAQRLRVDTRKWIMSKMKPKKYGEKIDHTTNGKDLPTPIYGGTSIQGYNSDKKDI